MYELFPSRPRAQRVVGRGTFRSRHTSPRRFSLRGLHHAAQLMRVRHVPVLSARPRLVARHPCTLSCGS